MTSAFETITKALDPMFAELDATIAAKNQIWAKERCEAVRAFDPSRFFKPGTKFVAFDQSHNYYAALFALAGGKTWYSVFKYGYTAATIKFVDKNSAATAKARNASIARKLVKAEITEVVSSDFAKSNDGFNGTFVVETNKGRKTVVIDTISAGGYNIQCWHLRVLVKIK